MISGWPSPPKRVQLKMTRKDGIFRRRKCEKEEVKEVNFVIGIRESGKIINKKLSGIGPYGREPDSPRWLVTFPSSWAVSVPIPRSRF